DPGAGTDQARGRDRQGIEDRVPDAARGRYQGGHQGGAEQRGFDLPDPHPREAAVSIQPFGVARELGVETVGFLMMSHTISPEKLAAQARIMADAGCQGVYVVDSAGALVLEGG